MRKAKEHQPPAFLLLAIRHTPWAPILFPIHPVVRSFFGDDDIVNMTLSEAGNRLPDERGVLLEIGNRLTPAVSHSRPDTTDQLIDHRRQGPLVRYTPFDPFRAPI